MVKITTINERESLRLGLKFGDGALNPNPSSASYKIKDVETGTLIKPSAYIQLTGREGEIIVPRSVNVILNTENDKERKVIIFDWDYNNDDEGGVKKYYYNIVKE